MWVIRRALHALRCEAQELGALGRAKRRRCQNSYAAITAGGCTVSIARNRERARGGRLLGSEEVFGLLGCRGASNPAIERFPICAVEDLPSLDIANR